MRDYGKVHTSFWTSPNIRSLSDDGRSLALYLLTCQHGTIAGVFRLPDGYICEDMQWEKERVSETLLELSRNGFATRCEVTKWVWVHKHLEWNPPENPNQRKAAAKVACQVPNSCTWRVDFIGKHGISLGICEQSQESKTEPFRNACETLSQPVTVTVTETVTVNPHTPAWGFDEFWSAYPKKTGKGAAQKAFEKIKPDPALLDSMLAAIAVQSASTQWRKDGGQFIPNPATWLNQSRWEDGGTTVIEKPSKWWTGAGFATEWDARNAECTPSTAHLFRDGLRISEVTQ